MQAAFTAMNLFYFHRISLGNVPVSRGWMRRMERLVERHGLAPLEGWVRLLRAYDRGEDDPAAGLAMAEEALAAARAGDDVDLELCALSLLGAQLVTLGRLEEGFALLDEAMAGALAGEGCRLDTVVIASCMMISSCGRAAQLARASRWLRAGEDFVRRYGSPHLFTTCRLHYGGLLLATGRWADAGRQLEEAIPTARAAEPALLAEVLARLAELRLAEGRVDEAAGLLAGLEDRPTSAAVLAAIHLARGQPAAAAALARGRLRATGGRCLESVVLVELLAEAELAMGVPLTARARAKRLAALGAEQGCELMTARAERVLGRTLAPRYHAAAVAHLERALDAFQRLDLPLEVARSHLLVSRVHGARDREGAIAAARAGLAIFEELGAARDADSARAQLRVLGARPSRGGRRALGRLSARETEVLALLGAGLTNRDIAARLFLTRKTVEHHVRSVLAKLALTNRAEAAAFAVRHLERDSAVG